MLAGQLMAVLDTSVVNVAVPSIHAGLHASGAALQLIVAGYVISYAVLLVTGARLGDLYGHRRVFLTGVAGFTLASLGCGLAPATGPLIALRFVQGAAAAVMIPQVLSLIQRTFTGAARARAMRAYSATLAGGVVLGQIVGGLLISADLFGSTWRPIFLVNVPIGLLVLAAGARLLPPGTRDPGRGLDLAGLGLLSLAVLALVVPLVLGQPEHWPAWGWASMAASAVLVAGFVLAERRLSGRGGAPIVPGRLLRLPGVAPGIAALFVNMTLFGGFFFAIALQLQSGLGESALRAGLTFAPAAASFGLVSLNWQRLPARLRPGLIVAGFTVAAAGMLGVAALLHGGGRGGAWLYLDDGHDRGRHGGRVQPADDRRADADPGGRRRGRDRGYRHRQPAGPGGRRGHVRHAVPEPGRGAARRPVAGHVPAAVRARRHGHDRGPGGRGRDGRRAGRPARAVAPHGPGKLGGAGRKAARLGSRDGRSQPGSGGADAEL